MSWSECCVCGVSVVCGVMCDGFVLCFNNATTMNRITKEK